jgi:hypothetical protein
MSEIANKRYRPHEDRFVEAVDNMLNSIEKRMNSLNPKVSTFNENYVNLEDNTVHVYNGKNGVTTLQIKYPEGDFVSTVLFSTASSGKISVSFPNGTRFVGSAAYEFFPAENWELNIHNGRVAGSLIT